MSSKPYDFAAEFQAVFVPKQKPAPAPVSKETRMGLSSYPPMGQVTQVLNGELTFLAVLEFDNSLQDKSWQVAIWHPAREGGPDWAETMLSRIETNAKPYALQSVDASIVRLYFSAQFSIQQFIQFTLKFRESTEHEWRWIRDEQGLNDGIIVVNPGLTKDGTNEKFKDIIAGLNPALTVKPGMSQCPATKLWTIETRVVGATDDHSSFTDFELGVPWGEYLRWFAVVRIWTPWLAPRHGKTHFALDKDAIMCSFLSPRGRHLVLLAVSGINDVLTVFRSNDSGRVILHVRNDSIQEETATVIAAIGDSFESANAAVMYHARTLATPVKLATNGLEEDMQSLLGDVRPEWMENWYDGLGFCTWNGLGQQLTDEKIFNAVDTLAEHNINIVSLIIDDNWQTIDKRKSDGQFQYSWKEFEADPKAFPKGLKDTITRIRSKHPGIQHIAVWHALLGYWGGISPDGKIAHTYKTIEVTKEDSKRRNLPMGGNMTVVAKEDVFQFYDDFYKFLASCGIDGVKTDAQFMMTTWVSAKTRRDLITAYQDAWTISSLRYFSIKVISCMSQAPQIIFHSQLPRNRPAVLCRNSDDFFPDIPSSHPWHVWANAHNSLFTQHLNVLPDWDMFQTVHDYSGFHAAARCVSGGPIYITDVPGSHNVDLIKQMSGVTTRGKTVIFRPSILGRSVDQYVGYDDDSLLKIGSYHGRSSTGTPILGVFNISARPLTDIIPLSRFPGVDPSVHYVVRAHSSGRLTDPIKIDSSCACLTVSLDVRGHDMFCAYPISTFDTRKVQVHTANLGLLGKMTGAAAIISSGFELQDNGRIFLDTRIKALGKLGVYISKLPDMTIEDNLMVTIQGSAVPPQTVSFCHRDKHVLEIDVETAWNEMNLQPGWSNEVEIKVYISVD